MYVPLLGRLSLSEWPLVVISLVLAWIEYTLTVITGVLPLWVITSFSSITLMVYTFTSHPIRLFKDVKNDDIKYKYLDGKLDDKDTYERMIGLLNSGDITEMCRLFGFDIEHRIVKTEDGYLLTVQRLIARDRPVTKNGKVVYLHHGLLMSSEIWVTMLEEKSNLPFLLYDLGYDVWLGNNRGNKYSQKHLIHPVYSERFWNFSLDEFAFFDIPNTIDYILNDTGAGSLTYIGFSQGTAQAFASCSIHPHLEYKIDQIIAISPATTPHGLYSSFLDIMVKMSPAVMYLMFSRRVLMPSVYFWQKMMFPPFFDTMIDLANYILFNWRSENITKIQKLCSYAHLYSTTSVKTVVHWFQIISHKNFQMYHDGSQLAGLTPVSYPMRNIRIPVHLIYGDSDSLVDIEVMKSQLPERYTTSLAVEGHEHLDNLWGNDVYAKVFVHVLRTLGEIDDDEVVGHREQPSIIYRSHLKLASAPEFDESTFASNFTIENTDKIHRSFSNGGFPV